jgi:hypothetical protein
MASFLLHRALSAAACGFSAARRISRNIVLNELKELKLLQQCAPEKKFNVMYVHSDITLSQSGRIKHLADDAAHIAYYSKCMRFEMRIVVDFSFK